MIVISVWEFGEWIKTLESTRVKLPENWTLVVRVIRLLPASVLSDWINANGSLLWQFNATCIQGVARSDDLDLSRLRTRRNDRTGVFDAFRDIERVCADRVLDWNKEKEDFLKIDPGFAVGAAHVRFVGEATGSVIVL